MELSTTLFKYKGLTHPDSVRLILLQPSNSHSTDLYCSFLHTTLWQCDRDLIDHYTALSYVWGDPKNTGFIFVHGIRVTITATLEAALRDLRDPARILLVWADALCIDQSNLTERASQVGLMAQIYATAHHTVVHLGSLTDKAEMVLRAAPSNTWGDISNELTSDQLIEMAEISLLKASWFTRVWIFQELVLSKALLSQAFGTLSKNRGSSLASWAPDWCLPGPNLAPMYYQSPIVLDEPIKDHEIAHFIPNEKPPTLAILGYEVDTIRDCSLVLPYSLQPNQERRATYQENCSGLSISLQSGLLGV